MAPPTDTELGFHSRRGIVFAAPRTTEAKPGEGFHRRRESRFTTREAECTGRMAANPSESVSSLAGSRISWPARQSSIFEREGGGMDWPSEAERGSHRRRKVLFPNPRSSHPYSKGKGGGMD